MLHAQAVRFRRSPQNPSEFGLRNVAPHQIRGFLGLQIESKNPINPLIQRIQIQTESQTQNNPLAQSAEALVLETRRCEFESHRGTIHRE
jgi:hypothetical protein